MRTILLVDDEDGIRGALRAYLEGQGLAVEEASDAVEAIKKANTLNGALAILVTDVVMPGMSGPDLAHVLRKTHSGLPVVFMSGYPAGEQVKAFEGATFLKKPFGGNELVDAVRAGLETFPNSAASKACGTSQ